MKTVVLSSALLLLAFQGFAQYGTGIILGTVTDPTGAIIPGAKVIAKDNSTNVEREVTTDESGNYQFNALASNCRSESSPCFPSFLSQRK